MIEKYEVTTIENDGRRHTTEHLADINDMPISHLLSQYVTVADGEWVFIKGTKSGRKWVFQYLETPPDIGGYVQRTRRELADNFGWTHQI